MNLREVSETKMGSLMCFMKMLANENFKSFKFVDVDVANIYLNSIITILWYSICILYCGDMYSYDATNQTTKTYEFFCNEL